MAFDASSTVAAGTSGILGLANSALNYRYSKKIAKQNYQYSRELADQQNQMNIDMWERQNAYNTPVAQMQRFEVAGLNPNLIYGQGNSGNASPPPEQKVGQYQLQIQDLGLLNGFAQAIHALSEAKLTDEKAKTMYQQRRLYALNGNNVQFRNLHERYKIDALRVYGGDDVSDLSDDYVKFLKGTNYYHDLERNLYDRNLAKERVELFKDQHEINRFQIETQNAFDEFVGLFDFLPKNIRPSARLLLRSLIGNMGGNSSIFK